jgi:hypothetical protein
LGGEALKPHSQNQGFSFSLSSSDRVRAMGETTVRELALEEIIVLLF